MVVIEEELVMDAGIWVMGYGYNTRKGAGTRRALSKDETHEDEDQCLLTLLCIVVKSELRH